MKFVFPHSVIQQEANFYGEGDNNTSTVFWSYHSNV